MSFLGWTALAGGLLLLMALSSAYLRRLPVTVSCIYLALGWAISPAWLGLVHISFVDESVFFEHLTEVAVIISLFIGGLKLRLPLRNESWSAAFRLAGPVMLLSIAGVAVVTHFLLGIGWGASCLLGAILAPTDPVLASMVAVNHSSDHDRMRYGLSGEAGLNDGAAFPFVLFALMWMENEGVGDWVGGWALHRVVWAVPLGLLTGYLLGKGGGRLAIGLRIRHQDTNAPNDFLALALIALSYVAAEAIGAWGFLAAFAAGIGFRRAEVSVVKSDPAPEHVNTDEPLAGELTSHPPAELLVGKQTNEEELKQPSKAAGMVMAEIISFGGTAERLLEMMMVVLVGVCLPAYWDWRAVPLSLALFFLIRPLATMLSLVKTPTSYMQRIVMGWFGIRGIGSLYYLSYALNHGLNRNFDDMVGLTLSVVALSVGIHGTTSQPLLDFYARVVSNKGREPC
jgi:NhaP-type Na+/H+ or K+/H+ antiporter